jgi:hypothetical protein
MTYDITIESLPVVPGPEAPEPNQPVQIRPTAIERSPKSKTTHYREEIDNIQGIRDRSTRQHPSILRLKHRHRLARPRIPIPDELRLVQDHTIPLHLSQQAPVLL